MPSWLTIDFVAANWQPLLVALVLGYILGWLFTGIPNKRHANEAEDRSASAEARLRKSESELTAVRRESEQHKARAAQVQVDLDASTARVRELESAAVAYEEVDEDETADNAGEDVDFPDVRGALAAEDVDGIALLAEVDDEVIPYSGDEMEIDEEEWKEIVALEGGSEDETQTMLIPAVDPRDDPNAAFADISQAYSAVAKSPDLSGMLTSKDIALTEAYARVTTLQAELDRNDALLRTRQVDLDALRAELAAANASRHELETRLIRSREDVASELAVLASTMIKMKDDALLRADARIAALSAEIENLRGTSQQPPVVAQPAAALPEGTSATAGRKVVPQVTAAGWEPGPYYEEDAPAPESATDDLPDMAKAIRALAEESAAQVDESVAEAADSVEESAEMSAEEGEFAQMPGLDPMTASTSSADEDTSDNANDDFVDESEDGTAEERV